MLSRVAESVFWMCRYIERAENTARVVNVNWQLSLDDASSAPQWKPLVSITGDEEAFARGYSEATAENVMRFLAFDPDYPNSILSCLQQARENARTIREIIPSDLWEQVNGFYHRVNHAANAGATQESPHGFFHMVIKESNEFIGRTMTTMTRDDTWYFCRAGRMLERADKTSRILDVKYYYLLPNVEEVGTSVDQIHWSALLRSVSALQAYRQRHGQIQPANVVDLLLLNNEFPRSVRFCVERVQESVRRMTGGAVGGRYVNDAERRCDQLRSQLACSESAEIIKAGVHEYIDTLQSKLNEIGHAIGAAFFDPGPSPTLSPDAAATTAQS